MKWLKNLFKPKKKVEEEPIIDVYELLLKKDLHIDKLKQRITDMEWEIFTLTEENNELINNITDLEAKIDYLENRDI